MNDTNQHQTKNIALCLPGGGLSGTLYQVGALAALEDGINGIHDQGFSLFFGHSSGATLAATLAGGIPIDRIYRALLDPADQFFPLERSHLFRFDTEEWKRMISTAWIAMRYGVSRLISKQNSSSNTTSLQNLQEQLDRFNDSLPAGMFSLMNYEQFLSDFFARRGISNSFENLPKPLRISSYDLDSGERVIFGSEGFRDVPVSVACAATLATPFFFSPVEIGTRQYIDGGLGDIAHFDVAEESGAKFVIVVNPLVPVSTSFRTVPTGHGAKHSIRDKGLIWVMNQALRISAHNRLHSAIEHVTKRSSMQVLVLEPEPTDMLLFLQNPANPKTRRAILEYAYRTTKDRIAAWLDRNREATNQMGWHTMNSREG